jgi:multisubunit Na+/H+ antiporter MnhB subunit
MRRTGTLTFGLFVIVVLGAIYLLLQRSGRASLGLVAVLVGILVLRLILFVVNMRQQRHNAERGKGPVKIETRLGIEDEPPQSNTEPPATPGR